MLPGVEFARRRRTSNYSSVHEDRSMRLRSKAAEHQNRELPRVTSSRGSQGLSSGSSAGRCLPPINTRFRADPHPHDTPMQRAALEARERLEARLRAAALRRADPLPILGLSHEDGALRLENAYLGRLQLLLARRSHHAANMNIDVSSFLAKHKYGGHEECSICLEAFVVDGMLFCLPCKHKFHAECVTAWIQSNGHCPYCRTSVVKSNRLP